MRWVQRSSLVSFSLITHLIIGQAVSQQASVAPALNLTPAQYAVRYVTPDGSRLIKPNAHNKNRMPFAWNLGTQRATVSFTLNSHLYVNHPSGSELFDNAALAASFNGLLASLQKAPQAVAYVRKVQFFALHDLFYYLVSIYTTFNLTHTDTPLAHLETEAMYALNKKAYILQHLLTIVQAQLHQAIQTYFPLLPPQLTLSTGNILISHDYGADINFLLENQEEQFFSGDTPATPEQQTIHKVVQAAQTTYRSALQAYLTFFSAYTSYLDSASQIPGQSQFATYAQSVARVLANNPSIKRSQALAQQPPKTLEDIQTAVSQLRGYKRVTPSLFSYTPESLQALNSILQAATELPKGVRSIGWPAHLIKLAQAGTQAVTKQHASLGYPIAYFKDAQGSITQNQAQAVKLCVNIPTHNNLYEQEVAVQPDWLNTRAGILQILRACLGDFTQILGLGILDPCLENLITQVTGSKIGTLSSQQCSDYTALIKQAQQEFVQDNNLFQQQPVQPLAASQPQLEPDQFQEQQALEQLENQPSTTP